MRTIQVETVDGFGEILSLAESLGWVDNHPDALEGEWTPQAVDACEEDALDWLTEHNVLVIDVNDNSVSNMEVLKDES